MDLTIDGLTHREVTVVFEHDCLLVAERFRQSLPLAHGDNDPGVIIQQRQIVIKSAGILGQRVEKPAKRGPGRAVD